MHLQSQYFPLHALFVRVRALWSVFANGEHVFPIYSDLMFSELLKIVYHISKEYPLILDWQIFPKQQTNKTAGFHFREDHGLAEISVLGQFANKCWIYSADLWMIVSSLWFYRNDILYHFIKCGVFCLIIFMILEWEKCVVEIGSDFRAAYG